MKPISINNFTRRADNALHELILILQFSLENMPKVSPLIVLEMRKYYPRAWRLFDDFRNDFILKSVRANLQKGIEEGLYRSNIQIDIVSAMHIAQTELAFNTELYPANNYDIWQIHLQSFEMYLYE